jgi:hypothetical protein
MTCVRCRAERPLANLRDGVCPECLAVAAEQQYTRQVLARPAPTVDYGLRVVDIPVRRGR